MRDANLVRLAARLLRRRLRGHMAMGAALLLAACAPVDLLNASIGTSGLVITRDLAYGPHDRQTLDIYRPAAAQTALPVMVFFYGGSWNSGSKAEYKFVATALARQGLVVVVPDYRLYPQVQYPLFLQDCARAVVWTAGNIAPYGGNPGALFVMGHSAGAYNAAMLALDPGLLKAAGGSTGMIRGTIALAGPYDFLPLTDPEVQGVFAPADADLARTQPINYVDGHNQPILLLAGTADTTVQPRNTTDLAARLRAAGGPVQDILYPGVAHIGLVLSFAPWFRGKAPALADSVAFIRAQAAAAD